MHAFSRFSKQEINFTNVYKYFSIRYQKPNLQMKINGQFSNIINKLYLYLPIHVCKVFIMKSFCVSIKLNPEIKPLN